MKTILAAVALMGGLAGAFAQDVFILGGAGTTPVPPIVYQPPVVAGDSAVTYQPVLAAVPVYATPAYPTMPACTSTYYSPNVIYVGSPGSCGNYYNYSRCYSPNVIYFGRDQAYRHGYNFGHR